MILYVGNNRKDEVTIKNAVARKSFKFAGAQSLLTLAKYVEGQQASMVFIEHPCSLIDAFEICKLVVRYNAVPVLIVRGLTKVDTQLALRNGVADIVVTPFSEDCVIERVEKLVSRLTSEGKSIRSQVSRVDHKSAKQIEDKVKMICTNAKDTLSLPPSVAKIVQLCNNPSTSASQIEQAAKTDAAVSAMILKRANSAALGGAKRIKVLRDGIVRIGVEETRTMALMLPVFDMMTAEEETFGFNRSNCWFHSLAVGVIAFFLAQEEQEYISEDAFLAGLLHDLGKVILDDHLNDEYTEVVRQAATRKCRIETVEREMFKMDHCHVGAVVADTWKLPEVVVTAIEDHHKPVRKPLLKTGRSSLSDYVALGNSFAKCLGLGHSGDYLVEDISDEYWQVRFGDVFPIHMFVRMIYGELKHYAEVLDINLEEFGVNLHGYKKDQQVMVCEGGISFLLEAYFTKSGYSVRRIKPTDIYKMEPHVWIVADDRGHKNSLSEILSMHPGSTFLMQDGERSSTIGNLNIISPALDFYQLDKVHREVAVNSGL